MLNVGVVVLFHAFILITSDDFVQDSCLFSSNDHLSIRIVTMSSFGGIKILFSWFLLRKQDPESLQELKVYNIVAKIEVYVRNHQMVTEFDRLWLKLGGSEIKRRNETWMTRKLV